MNSETRKKNVSNIYTKRIGCKLNGIEIDISINISLKS